MRRLILILIIFTLGISNPVSAFWIWSPKTGKWVNPKYAVKPIPIEQLAFALGFYKQDKLKEARREFIKLLKHYPKSSQAAEAQYYLGAIEQSQGRLYEAFLAFQKVIDKYPFSPRLNEIIDKEFEIAQAFMQGEKRKAFGVVLPVENPAIEIFRKVIDNSTYGPRAAEAQYKLGLILKNLDRFFEAEDEFNKLIKNYPQSEWVIAAEFQIAACQASISSGPDYNQEITREAKEKFEEFLLSHPDAELSNQAEKNIQRLKEKEAQSYYDIAVFYEKQKAYSAARIYYNLVISDYAQSSWADKARSKLEAIGEEDEKD